MSETTPPSMPFPKPPPGLDILYEDDSLVVVNKPPWLLSVPGRGPDKHDSAMTRAQEACGEIYVVHRLDCATSGIMAFARHKSAERELHRQFREREPDKTYIAVCAGTAPETQGIVDLPLITDWPNRPRQMVDHERGKPSQTHYRVLQQEADNVRIELKPITGRSHQLRVHMAELELPILGDRLYAPPPVLARSERLLLHAEALTINHPDSKEPLAFNCPTPF